MKKNKIIGLVGLIMLSSTLTACGGGNKDKGSSTGGSSATPGVSLMAATDPSINPGGARLTQVNVERLYVDQGPASIAPSSFVNPVYADIKVCEPGNPNNCATIDHMLVDTGSVGVRIMASAIPPNLMNVLPIETEVVGPATNNVGQCLAFAQGVTWGGVRRADVSMGGTSQSGLTASDLKIQVIGDPDGAFGSVPGGCTSQGDLQNSVSAFGANGILGVGLFIADCGPACAAGATPPDVYFECDTNGACNAIFRAEADQVRNPVAEFASHNNGVSLILPEVASTGSVNAEGFLVFGVNTASNNITASNAKKLSTSDNGYITTQYNGLTLAESFIDSGSSVYIIPQGGTQNIALCGAPLANFYCPNSTLTFNNTNTGFGSEVETALVTIGNATSLLSGATTRYAYSNLAATSSALPDSFDYGASFFFKKQVSFLIETKGASGWVTGPAVGYTP